MKKIIAFVLSLVLLLSLASCKGGNPYKRITDEEIEIKVDEGSLQKLNCYYSVDNDNREDEEILVHFPADIYDSKKDVFYDENNETHIVFYGDKVFYDKETGKEISEDNLEYGQLLEVVYNGEAFSSDPVTVKAVKVFVCD